MLKDNTKYGILLGILGPLIAIVIFYFWKYYGAQMSFSEFFEVLMYKGNRTPLVKTLSFSMIANSATFTLFINKHKDNTAKGIFIVTMIWVVIILLLMYVL